MKRIVLVMVASFVLSGCIHESLLSRFTQRNGTGENKETVTEGRTSEIVTVVLNELNTSGQEGVATLQELDGKIKVIIAATSLGETPQPAHIHVGRCPNPEGVKYPLTDVVAGKSETIVNVSIGTLTSGQFAINVHRNNKDFKTYTACGDVK